MATAASKPLRHFSESLPRPASHKPSSHVRLPRVTLSALSSSSAASPFTEANSQSRYQRETWVQTQPTRNYQNNLDNKSNDIALQLPELKKLLEALRASRENEGGRLESTTVPGRVALVGTGPGDPELLTLKAVRAIEKADLILYDRLVSNDVLELVQPDARLLYVGKTAGYHSRTQVRHKLVSNYRIFLKVTICNGLCMVGDLLIIPMCVGGDTSVTSKLCGGGSQCGQVERRRSIGMHFIPVSDVLFCSFTLAGCFM